MKIDGNYALLHLLNNDINLQSQRSPAFALFNKEKIRRFQQLNEYRLRLLDKNHTALVKKYVQHDEEGKPKTQKNDKGGEEYLYESEEKKDQHTKEHEEFMSQGIDILS